MNDKQLPAGGSAELVVKPDFSGFLGEWETYLREELRSAETTIRTYLREVTRFIEWFEENPQVLTRETFVLYRNELLENYSPNTVNIALASTRGFFGFLRDSGYIPNNPSEGVRGVKRKTKKHLRDALTPGEVRRLLGVIPEDTPEGIRDNAIIRTMLYCGFRTVEVHRLNVGSLQTRSDSLVLMIQGKGRTSEDDFGVVLPELEGELAKWLRIHPSPRDENSPMFCSLSNRSFGKRLSLSYIRRLIGEYFRAAGIVGKRKTAHSLRKSAITAVIRGGGTLRDAQVLARHNDPKTTMIYLEEVRRLEQPPERLIEY